MIYHSKYLSVQNLENLLITHFAYQHTVRDMNAVKNYMVHIVYDISYIISSITKGTLMILHLQLREATEGGFPLEEEEGLL